MMSKGIGGIPEAELLEEPLCAFLAHCVAEEADAFLWHDVPLVFVPGTS